MNEEIKFPYVVHLAAESVISPLPESQRQRIRAGARLGTSTGTNASPFLNNSYAVSYNRRNDDLNSLDLPRGLIEDIQKAGGIPDSGGRFGAMTEQSLVLNYQETVESDSGFLLIVSAEDFNELVHELFPDSKLTEAEVRLLMHITCGIDLKQAAVIDAVAYETKRTQYKSVSRKTGFSKQSDLAVFLTTRLTLELKSGNYAQHRSIQNIFEIHRQTMHSDIQLHVRADEQGNMHRLLDMGPKSGHPYLVLHGTALPLLTDEDINFLTNNRIRLIWPLRRGLMEANDRDEGIDQFKTFYAQTIQMALDFVSASQLPVDIIAVGSGCSHAIELAKQYPQQVACIDFITACYRPSSEINSTNRIAAGFDKLAAISPATFALVFRMMRSQLRKPKAFASYMRGLGSGCDADSRIVEYELADPERLRNFQTRILSSVDFFVYDHALRSETDWEYLRSDTVAARFFHGDDDAFYPVRGIQQLAEQYNKPLIVLPDTGHFIYMEHWAKALSVIHSNK